MGFAVLLTAIYYRLAMVACRQVLVRKQTGYGAVIAWLEEETRRLSAKKGVDTEMLVSVAKGVSVQPRGGKA